MSRRSRKVYLFQNLRGLFCEVKAPSSFTFQNTILFVLVYFLLSDLVVKLCMGRCINSHFVFHFKEQF